MPDFSWVAIVVAVIGLVSASLVARSTNRKANSESAEVLSSAAVVLIEPLKEQVEGLLDARVKQTVRIDALEKEAREVKALRFENQRLRERVNHLEVQVDKLSISAEEAEELEEKLRFERERSGTLAEAVGALAGQVIGLGGDPVVDLGEEPNVE